MVDARSYGDDGVCGFKLKWHEEVGVTQWLVCFHEEEDVVVFTWF